MVLLQGVSKTYQQGECRVVALEGVTLSLQSGRFHAITGPSGSGKSTLLHLIAGLDLPSSGEIWIDGRSTRGLSEAEWIRIRRDRIGFVFQFFNLLPTLTAWENVALPLLLRGEPQTLITKRVDESFTYVDLSHRQRHYPHQLSGGEMQRVAIARAFVTNPDIILADEPTGNLDSGIGQEILQLLKMSVTQRGHTVIMATHSLEAAEYADRVIRLMDGRVVSDEGN